MSRMKQVKFHTFQEKFVVIILDVYIRQHVYCQESICLHLTVYCYDNGWQPTMQLWWQQYKNILLLEFIEIINRTMSCRWIWLYSKILKWREFMWCCCIDNHIVFVHKEQYICILWNSEQWSHSEKLNKSHSRFVSIKYVNDFCFRFHFSWKVSTVELKCSIPNIFYSNLRKICF